MNRILIILDLKYVCSIISGLIKMWNHCNITIMMNSPSKTSVFVRLTHDLKIYNFFSKLKTGQPMWNLV